MDPISVVIVGLIIAALRGPASAGRAVRADYRARNARWQRGASSWGGASARPGVRGMPRRAAGRVRPGAIRSGIRLGAMGASTIFAGGAMVRGFRRGWKAGYRSVRVRRNHRQAWKQPTAPIVDPGVAGAAHGKDDEILDAEIVLDPPVSSTPPPAAGPNPVDAWDAASTDWVEEAVPTAPAGLGPGTGSAPTTPTAPASPVAGLAPAAAGAAPTVTAPAVALGGPASPVVTIPVQYQPTSGGPIMANSLSRTGSVATGGLITPAPISMPSILTDANYHNHLTNLGTIAGESTQQMSAAQLAATAANAARQRAVNMLNALDHIAAGLASQDFGSEHVGNVANLQELMARLAQLSAIAEQAAIQAIEVSTQVVAAAAASAAAFRRDHQVLAEAHAASPHPARTREAYQPQ